MPDFQNIRERLHLAGGLVDRLALAKRWGLTPFQVDQLTASQGFPDPVDTIDGRNVWIAGEADKWFRDHGRPMDGRS